MCRQATYGLELVSGGQLPLRVGLLMAPSGMLRRVSEAGGAPGDTWCYLFHQTTDPDALCITTTVIFVSLVILNAAIPDASVFSH